MNTTRGQLGFFGLLFTFTVTSQALSVAQTPTRQSENLYKQFAAGDNKQLATGLLARTLFTATSGAGFSVVIRDLLIGPGQKTSQVSLPGPAVFEVRSGAGIIFISGQSQEIQAGSSFELSQGETFQIRNQANTPITMIVHQFMAETPVP